MQKQAQPKAKEDKGPLISVKLGASGTKTKTGGGGFKKGGFKNAFAEPEEEAQEKDKSVQPTAAPVADVVMKDVVATTNVEDMDSDFTDEDDYYDPARPTDCTPSCRGRLAAANT